MGLSKNKKVQLNEVSLMGFIEEAYIELEQLKKEALLSYKIYKKDIKDNSDINLVGKVANDSLKIYDGIIEKKLKLIKLQSDIIYRNSKNSEISADDFKMTEEDKNNLMDQIKSNGADFFSEKLYE